MVKRAVYVLLKYGEYGRACPGGPRFVCISDWHSQCCSLNNLFRLFWFVSCNPPILLPTCLSMMDYSEITRELGDSS
jgi:hypothetical protein